MKKQRGKIRPSPHEKMVNLKMELRRADYKNSNRGDMETDIDIAVGKIHELDKRAEGLLEKTDFMLADNTRYAELKKRIENLREGSGVHGINCKNLDEHYREYKEGKYDAFQFLCDVEKLFGELNRECNEVLELFAYGHIERKEAEHEGIDSVFGI